MTPLTRAQAWLLQRPALALFAGASVVGLVTLPSVGWSDDARFYVPAAAAYARWLEAALSLDLQAFTRASIDAAFGQNHEHPPVAKYLMGLGWMVLHQGLGLTDEVTACRVPIVLTWAWTCALVYQIAAPSLGRAAALFASLAFATLPRLFFDAHAETLDMPVAAFVLATAHALLTELDAPSWRASARTVLMFSLALGCKLNAPFFAVSATLAWLATSPPRRMGTSFGLRPLPLGLVGMVLISPLLAAASWPWLWHSTAARLATYAGFHLKHYGILFYYQGTLFGETLAPWSAPWVLTALATPLTILVLALLGCGALLRRSHTPRSKLAWLALTSALVQIGSVSLPGVPVYAGVKLFLPAFAFIALLAGCGFRGVLDELEAMGAPRAKAALTCAVMALTPSLIGLVAYQGAWLSYYGELAGGLRGAVAGGFERQYYDVAYPSLRDALARALPQGGSYAVLPNPKEYAPHLARWHSRGELPKVRQVAPEHADVLVLTHEERWSDYPMLMARYRTRPLIERVDVAGVALFSVYDLRVATAAQRR